jgi:hypothetical protein
LNRAMITRISSSTADELHDCYRHGLLQTC